VFVDGGGDVEQDVDQSADELGVLQPVEPAGVDGHGFPQRRQVGGVGGRGQQPGQGVAYGVVSLLGYGAAPPR
jgi:hypothetical protein